MTTPQPTPDQPPPAQQGLQHPIVDATAAATIAALLAGMMRLPNLPGQTAPQRRTALLGSYEGRQIVDQLTNRGAPATVAAAVLGMTLGNNPIPHTTRAAPATAKVRRETQQTNLLRRAQYLLNASGRVAGSYRRNVADQSTPDTLPGRRDALAGALSSERSYWRAHVAAQQARNAAARKLDDAVDQHGNTLGWYAFRGPDGEMDARTTRACRQADGRNFTASRRPAIGYPGALGPHVHCRCEPGAPHATNDTVYGIRPD